MPLVSYIGNSLKFWYYASLSLVPVVRILKKIEVNEKTWEKAGVKLLMDLTEKSVRFSALATSSIRVLLFLVRGSTNEISPIGEKKINGHRRKPQENDNFLTKQSPFLSPNFIQGSMVIVIAHNVEFYKQYFLQKCVLLIRKTYN